MKQNEIEFLRQKKKFNIQKETNVCEVLNP